LLSQKGYFCEVYVPAAFWFRQGSAFSETCLISSKVSPSRFGYRLGAFPRFETLGSFFIPQRSWDSPYRVFPSLGGKSSLRTISSSHCVGHTTVTRQLGLVFIEQRRIQSFGPSISPCLPGRILLQSGYRYSFELMPLQSLPRSVNKPAFTAFPL